MIFQKTKNHYQSNSNQSKNEGTDINDIGLEYKDIGQIKHESFITLEKKMKKKSGCYLATTTLKSMGAEVSTEPIPTRTLLYLL